MLNIYVNTWGNYNENGADGGKWLTLPMDTDNLEEELEAIAAAMGDNDPEWAIHDYEWTTEIEDLFPVSEYDNITELNERLQELETLEEWELEEVAAAMEAFSYSFLEAVDRQQRGYFTLYRNMDLEEVAEELEYEKEQEEWVSENKRVSARMSITHETSEEAVASMESAIEGTEGILESLEEIIGAFDEVFEDLDDAINA